ncbi:hypothetical protein KQ693_10315 [Thermus sp. PS18]|uniref:hypothetical protein n=1 Tax=Thermus sp. PS18 TaxID=2849039 RepID=UPI002263E1BF|nr:hypothetical protein [Thermus sp. PS18]UZX15009.1 hypothetical protein KQ693_10315 [Thermus sp. PS18]
MDLRDELLALHLAFRRHHEEVLGEIRALREELARERRARYAERGLLLLALVLALVGWWRP